MQHGHPADLVNTIICSVVIAMNYLGLEGLGLEIDGNCGGGGFRFGGRLPSIDVIVMTSRLSARLKPKLQLNPIPTARSNKQVTKRGADPPRPARDDTIELYVGDYML